MFKKLKIYENGLHNYWYKNAVYRKSKMTKSFSFPCRISQYMTFYFLDPFFGRFLKTKLIDFLIFQNLKIYENILPKFEHKNAFFQKSEMTESCPFPCTISQYMAFYFSDPFGGRFVKNKTERFSNFPKIGNLSKCFA